MRIIAFYLSVLLCTLMGINLSAQDKSNTATISAAERYVIVSMRNGNEHRGRVAEQTLENITLETLSLGFIEIPMKDVVRIKESTEKRVMFDFGRHQAVSTRYFFGTNGLSVKKNAGYYQNTWLWFNQVNYGITDNLSVGGGTVPIFLLFPGAALVTPIWGTVKYAFPLENEKFHASIGVLAGRAGSLGRSGFGLAFTQMTFGDERNNINVGMGYGFLSSDLAQRPTFTLSGTFQTRRRGAIIGETYLINTESGSQLVVSGGMRIYMKKISLDAAMVTIPGEFSVGIPWLGISVPFGKY